MEFGPMNENTTTSVTRKLEKNVVPFPSPQSILHARMTSMEIAELTDKNHKEVLRDIRNLIDQGAVNERNFALVDYKDGNDGSYYRLRCNPPSARYRPMDGSGDRRG
jgi:phage regulator Rha-like protein